MKNEDQQCFKWCVMRTLNPVNKDPQRITKLLRKHSKILKWGDVKFPVKLRDIDKFKRLNPRISINVFDHEGKKIYPLRISGTCARRLKREIRMQATINLI